MILDDKGKPVDVAPIPVATEDGYQRRVAAGAFFQAMQSEMDGAMRELGDRLSKHYWGDEPPKSAPTRYVPTLRERIRWRWTSARQAVARAALWLLRVQARDICDCDY